MKPEGERYRICVDFDGVIHSYTSPWKEPWLIPDPPVPGAIEWLNEMAKHFEVVILTTRGQTTDGRRAIGEWLRLNGIEFEPIVTAEKWPALIYLDDRAIRFDGTNFPTRSEVLRARPWNKSQEATDVHQ